MTSLPPARELRAALTRFEALLEARAKERDFQRLFADCPYILSSTLPLRLEPGEIRPLGRPGKSEPDFIVFPETGGLRSGYGVIELKRPTSRILSESRKGVLMLSRDARTAIAQSQVYGAHLNDHGLAAQRVLMLGNSMTIFVIMGLSNELADKLSSDIYAQPS